MMRSFCFALAMAASGAAWAETPAGRDSFVIAGDSCGASRYAHLVGEPVAELYHAALPANANLVAQTGRLTTLEYEPARLNVVVSGTGRIVAIGCF